MKGKREAGLCTHGISDDVIVIDTTEVIDYCLDTVHRTLGYYCPRHRQYGYMHLRQELPPEQWKSMVGLPVGPA